MCGSSCYRMFRNTTFIYLINWLFLLPISQIVKMWWDKQYKTSQSWQWGDDAHGCGVGGCGAIGKLPTSAFDGMCGVKWCRGGTGYVQCSCYTSSALRHQTTLSWSKCVLSISNAQTLVEGRPRVLATLCHPSMSDLLLGRLLVVCFLEQIVLAANGWIKFSCNCWRSCKAMLDIEALLCY